MLPQSTSAQPLMPAQRGRWRLSGQGLPSGLLESEAFGTSTHVTHTGLPGRCAQALRGVDQDGGSLGSKDILQDTVTITFGCPKWLPRCPSRHTR